MDIQWQHCNEKNWMPRMHICGQKQEGGCEQADSKKANDSRNYNSLDYKVITCLSLCISEVKIHF